MAASDNSPINFPQHRSLKRTALLALLLFMVSLPAVTAQAPPPLPRLATNNGAPYNPTVSPTLSIIIIAFVGALCVLIFFLIYIRCCIGGHRSVVAPVSITLPHHRGHIRGLDSALLETFPTMVYSDVKGHKIGKESLECAVCLCEFEDDDILRLLPICSHVFHRNCIDVWLDSHVTCPVCRRNLAADPFPETDHAIIAVDQEVEYLTDLVRIGSQRRLRSGSVRGVPMGSVSRADWEAVVAGGDGRFRLQLPEDVRREILEAGRLRRSASMGFFAARKEGSSRRGYRDGRVGVWRNLRLVQSARWPILGRNSSARGREVEVEGSLPGDLKAGRLASIKSSFGMINGGGDGGKSSGVVGCGNGGGSRMKPSDGDASTAAYPQGL